MGNTELQQPTNLGDTVHDYSSPACWMHEVDPGYLGYWSREEVLVFLKSLLEQERGGTKAFANIGQAANLQIADLILGSELDQGEICVLLQKEIAMRGGAVAVPRKRLTNEHRTKCSLEHAIASATANQTELVQAIEQAVSNIFDAELSSHLNRMLHLHRKQLVRIKTLFT
jgi:hypothetical protein